MLRAQVRRRFAPSLSESASCLEDRVVLSTVPTVVSPPITMPPSPAPAGVGGQSVRPPITMPPSPAPIGVTGGAASEGPSAPVTPIIGFGPYVQGPSTPPPNSSVGPFVV